MVGAARRLATRTVRVPGRFSELPTGNLAGPRTRGARTWVSLTKSRARSSRPPAISPATSRCAARAARRSARARPRTSWRATRRGPTARRRGRQPGAQDRVGFSGRRGAGADRRLRPGRRYCGALRAAPPLPSRRPRPARRGFAGGMDAARRVHGRGGAAAARRDADHGGAAVGGARAEGLECVDGGDPQRLLRRVRARAAARRRAGRPVRRAPAGAGRPRRVRGRRRRRARSCRASARWSPLASCRAWAPGWSARRRWPAR